MNLTIGGILDSCVHLGASRVAATIGTSQYTFGELNRNASRLAHTLAKLAVGSGDIVAWLAGASLRTLDGLVAVNRLGAVIAPVNPALPPAEVGAILAYLRPRLLVTDSEHAELGEQLCADLGIALAVFGASRPPGTDLDGAMRQASDARVGVDVDDRLPHIIYLTSGSTGAPKGALVSHRASWLRSAAGGGTFSRGLAGPGGVVTGFPLYHYGGWHYVIEAWQNRRPIHLIRRPVASELLDAVQRWRACALYAIPAVWERVLEVPAADFDLSSLRHADTGTSYTSESLLERIKLRTPGARTAVHYGSTEAGHMASLHDEEIAAHPGSVGRPAAPGALWLGEDDEVLCASPAMMDSYLRLPAETATALQGGVYHSGDVGAFDEDGFLYLTGRTRELIRSGGESIWPVEVETMLRDAPGVADLAVVGVPDERWGEIVCAAVVVAPGHECPDLATLRRHVADRLPTFKHPRMLVAVAEIPRTSATGQVRRKALAASIAARR